ncbi:MAG: hypothetical protein ACKVOW_15855 [Chitinophagaceae bacterium]
MKSVFLLIIAFITILPIAKAQQKAAKSVYFELGGPGVASFNFDTRFGKKENGLGARVGFGGLSLGGNTALFIPVGLNYLFGKETTNYFELGGGITPLIASGDFIGDDGIFSSTFGYLNFGYRYQPAIAGFIFRVAINPVFNKNGFFPIYGGISFGYKF